MNERCLVILSTYNKAGSLTPFVEEILLVGDLLGEPAVNVLLIDDNSPDGTGTIAEQLKEGHRGRVEVLHRLARLGMGSAYVTGFRYALASGYDYVVQMAPDFSHDPSLLPRLLRAARDADVVLGSRHVVGRSTSRSPVGNRPAVWRRLLSRVGSFYAGLMLGLGYHDLTGGYKCFRRSALEALDLSTIKRDDEAFQIEVTYQCAQLGLRIVEVPALPRDRTTPPLSLRTLWNALLEVWQLRFAGAALLSTLGLKGKHPPAARIPVEHQDRKTRSP